MDISTIGKASVKHKEEQDCYNCGKKGHLVRQCRVSKKEGSNWKPVSNIRIARAITTTTPMTGTKMLAATECKVTWVEVV